MSLVRIALISLTIAPVALAPFSAEATELFRHDRGRVVACYAKAARPAEYELAAHKVLARPAWTEQRVEPALYEERVERVLVSPARTVWVARAPVYEIVMVHVVVRAAYRKWRTVVDEGGNAIRYEIIVPAEVVAVPRRVLVSDGGRMKIRQLAVYRNVSRPVLVKSERTRVIRHAAVYRTVHERLLVRPSPSRWVKFCG